MGLTSSSTRNGRISSNRSGNDKIVASTRAMSKALMNHLVSRHQFCDHISIQFILLMHKSILIFYQILSKIFYQVSIPDLKSCRLVSHDWADQAATLLGCRVYLHAHQLFVYHGSNLNLATPLVNQKLIKSLKIYEEFDTVAQKNKAIDIITKGLSMLISKDILHVSAFMGKYKICLELDIPEKLNVHPNLTSITFRPGELKENGSFHPLLQSLIDSAPNLTFLDVWASFPDLERCKKLESFKLYFHRSDRAINIDNITAMLRQVKNSLTEVELKYLNDAPGGYQRRSMDVPVMSKLASLTYDVGHECLHTKFLNEENLPALKNLSFKNSFASRKLSDRLNMWQRHRGVQSLTLELCYKHRQEEFAERIVQLFPNVGKFEMKMNFFAHSSIHEINRVMEQLKMWELEESNVDVDYLGQAALIVIILRNMSLWRAELGV
ncbi:uncharacterized protein LOC118437074 isoform X2 [Folsomia candida]|uniref:uncharacterized protein LOC118437074 isoform X2 n=1 Tax=Folsomia candida TaxID=158441 RepID=UPI001605016C|nr:uncharacterized protein LOC118437074 isoform X2 [Folsomia candida]